MEFHALKVESIDASQETLDQIAEMLHEIAIDSKKFKI